MPQTGSAVFRSALNPKPTRQQANAARLAKNGLGFLHPMRARPAAPAAPKEPMQLVQILAYFAEDNSNEPAQNRVVMLWQHMVGFELCPIHVEIYFPTEQKACSITQGNLLTLGPRSFSSNKYRVLSIEVSPCHGPGFVADPHGHTASAADPPRSVQVRQSQYDAMIEYCRRRVADNVSFDLGGMYTSVLPSSLRVGGGSGRTFCSRHIAETLREGGVPAFLEVDACSMSPAKLLQIVISECNPVMDVIQTREFK